MTTIRNKYLTLLSAIGITCAGCHNGSSWDPSEPDNSLSLSAPEMLTLNLDVSYDVNGSGASTRTDQGDYDGYETAVGDFEKINTLRVIIARDIMIINKAGVTTTYGIIEANRLVATTDQGAPMYDNLEFKVRANGNKRIYLVANEKSINYVPGNLPEGFPKSFASASDFLNYYSPKKDEVAIELDPLADWTVSMPVSDAEHNETTEGFYSDAQGIRPRLPLTEFFDIKLNPDKTTPDSTYYSQLFITRTAAKATFIVDQENSSPAYDNVKITALKLHGIGSEEYVFPRKATYSPKDKYPIGELQLEATATWTRPSESLKMYITDFETPTDNTLTYLVTLEQPIPIVKEDAGENTKREVLGPIYFPESILAKDKHYEVGVQLSTGVWLTAPLETNILNIGGRDAVARNTHLKITFGFTPQGLAAEVSVVPYVEISLDPEFGNFNPNPEGEVNSPVISWPTHNYNDI